MTRFDFQPETTAEAVAFQQFERGLRDTAPVTTRDERDDAAADFAMALVLTREAQFEVCPQVVVPFFLEVMAEADRDADLADVMERVAVRATS